MWVVERASGKMLDANRAAQQLFGRSRRALIGLGAGALRRLRPQGWQTASHGFTSDGRQLVLELARPDAAHARRLEREPARMLAESVVETVREPLLVLDRRLRVVAANRSFYRLFRSEPARTLGRPLYELGNRQWDIPRLRELLEAILLHNRHFDDFEVEHDFEDIGRRTMLLNARRLRHEERATELILLAIEDVTERRRAEEQLRLAAMVFEQAEEAVLITDAGERIVAVNRAFSEQTGYAASEVLGQTPRLLRSGRHGAAFWAAFRAALAQRGRWRGEVWNRRKSGELYPVSLSVAAVRDARGALSHYVAVQRDLSAGKAQAARVERLAFYDRLTGLPNRALLVDRLEQALAAARRAGRPLALLFLDLDRFKEVNDACGHSAGDRVLAEAARRMQATLRQEETLARLGGDEFVVVAAGADAAAAAFMFERLARALARPLRVEERSFSLGASAGVALFPRDGAREDELLRHADLALHRAKDQGGGRCCFYEARMERELARSLELATRLARALRARALELHYQPQIELASGALAGVEALARWYEPDWGWVPPAEFVALAEERGLAPALGRWVLREACRQLASWRAEGYELPPRIAVNVSARELEQGDYLGRLRALVARAGLAPRQLELELTETTIAARPEESGRVLGALRAIGIGLAIDDFGIGYSSLSQLKRFRADTLKIDASFVRGMLSAPADREIVATAIAIAHALGMKALAEGVEHAAQSEALRELGCDLAQGYYFGRPEPASEFARGWLRRAR